jgi:DNA invertase Pin-like site-specific DNA recombinase
LPDVRDFATNSEHREEGRIFVGVPGKSSHSKQQVENIAGLDAMLKEAQRGAFDVVMAWSIDRVGRSLIDLLGTIQHLEACHVDLYLDQQAIDTTTPTGKLMFQVTGAFAEFERSMIRERVHAGLKRAKAAGKVLGRRPVEDDPDGAAKVRKARKMLEAGKGINKVAKAIGLSNGTVARLKAEIVTH